MNKNETLITIITKILNDKLKQILQTKLCKSTCLTIYCLIFDTVVEIFEKSSEKLNYKFSNEAINWISQSIYNTIHINNTDLTLDPKIFTQKASLSNIEKKELIILFTLFKDATFAQEIYFQIKK